LYALLDCFTVSHSIATNGKIKRTNCYAVCLQHPRGVEVKGTQDKGDTRTAAAAAP